MRARLVVLSAVSLLTACLQPTDTQVDSVSLAGRWQYTAQQNGTTITMLAGTMIIEQHAGAAGFQGYLNVVSTSAETGEGRSVAGTLSGSAASANAVDFDVFLEPVARRHVAHLAGDMLTGTWVRVADDGLSASGSFSAKRIQ